MVGIEATPSPPRSGGEGRGEEVRWLDRTAPLSGSLPAGRGERENAAVYAEPIYAIPQFSRHRDFRGRILSHTQRQARQCLIVDIECNTHAKERTRIILLRNTINACVREGASLRRDRGEFCTKKDAFRRRKLFFQVDRRCLRHAFGFSYGHNECPRWKTRPALRRRRITRLPCRRLLRRAV